jgi:hypothetical protein
VIAWVVPDILKDHGAFVFDTQAVQEDPRKGRHFNPISASDHSSKDIVMSQRPECSESNVLA